MKKLLIVGLALCLVACGDHGMRPSEWDKAVQLCAANGGLKSARHAYHDGNDFIDAYCNNEAQFTGIKVDGK
jgi:hypothetical protein